MNPHHAHEVIYDKNTTDMGSDNNSVVVGREKGTLTLAVVTKGTEGKRE